MNERTKLSKKMSYLLRHNPEDLTIDSEGWVPFQQFVQKLSTNEEIVREVVRLCPKQRFAVRSDNGTEYIRANQGHTAENIEVTFKEATPEHSLYHGTTSERLEKIEASGGLKPMSRHHGHLSADQTTAGNVAGRWKGETPIMLKIDAPRMVRNGMKFYLSENGVWLTNSVPMEYINYRLLRRECGSSSSKPHFHALHIRQPQPKWFERILPRCRSSSGGPNILAARAGFA